MKHFQNECGQGMVEYALLIILVAIFLIGSLTVLGNSSVRVIYEDILSLLP